MLWNTSFARTAEQEWKVKIMKIEKLQVDALKTILKGHPEQVVHGRLKDGRIGVGSPYFLGFLPEDQIHVILDHPPFPKMGEKMDLDFDEYELGKEMYTFDDKGNKTKITKFQTESGKVAYLNPVFLKYFDKDARVFIKSRRNLICIFEEVAVFAGVIFPVNIVEGR